jgi:hypothetical protein
MDRPRQHALARATLAANQDGGLGGGHRERHVQRRAHPRLAGSQVGFRHHRADLFLQLLDVRLQSPHLRDPINHGAQLVGLERLGQIVKRPAPHGLDRSLNRGIRRHDHDVQTRSQLQQPRQQIQPLLPG